MTSLPNASLPTFGGLDAPDLRERIREMVLEQLTSSQGLGHLTHQEMDQIISKLPRLDERQVDTLGHKDSLCPICFVPLLALLAEEETAIALDSPAHPIEELGVTRLAESHQCNHLFCRRDITRWVTDGHDSCPTCRRPLLERDSNSAAESEGGSVPRTEDAYDAIDLQRILEHITTQGIDIEGLGRDEPEGVDFGAASAFFPFLQPNTSSTSHSDRSEYAGMYS